MSNKTNLELAEIFYEMAELFQLKNVKWKPQAYIVVAQMLESMPGDVSKIYKHGGQDAIEELPGVGSGIAKKIIQYIQEKRIDEYENLRASIPAPMYEMMQIPGVGAKKALLFYNKLGIKNIDELYRAAEEHRLLCLPGFKERAEQKILEGINLFKSKKPRMPLKKAEKLANSIISELKNLPEIKEVVAAGSLRRKKPTVGDIDIIIRAGKPESALKKFVRMKFVKEILGAGKEKATIIMKNGVQADARAFTDEEFGAGLLYFTGDKQHNIWLRKRAIKKGLKLNEYGLFDKKTGKRIAGESEEEIYRKLGISKIPAPEKRIGEISV